MAQGLNQITISGAVTTLQGLTKTSTGTSMLKFTISGVTPALDRNGYVELNEKGEVITRTYYRNITLFGRQAESAVESIAEGTPLLITGRITQREWTTQDGSKRSALDIRADTVHIVDAEATPGRLDDMYRPDAKAQNRLNHAINRATLIGNLVFEADLRQTKNANVNVLPLRIAVTTSYRDRNNDYKDTTAFIDVTAWRDLAAELQALPKGTSLFVEGVFNQRSWETQDGTRVWQDYVEAVNVEVLNRPGAKPRDEEAPAEQPQQYAPPASAPAPAPQQPAPEQQQCAPAQQQAMPAAPTQPAQQPQASYAPPAQPQTPAAPPANTPTPTAQPAAPQATHGNPAASQAVVQQHATTPVPAQQPAVTQDGGGHTSAHSPISREAEPF